ncbi:MAG: hypothetical protein QOD75_817 [Blastocatellia bacterium]|nr:hypothetical protein [Blastocatellia bacterium]
MNWATIIRDYQIRHRTNSQRELIWFRDQPSLEAAIVTAARARDKHGKRYVHQNRIRQEALPKAEAHLLARQNELRSCSCFHELWLLIKDTLELIYGIGELYVYDASLRIGAYLDLRPERVYLHSGTRWGARVFGFETRNRKWLELTKLPEILQKMPAHEIEDILCIYRHESPFLRTILPIAT